ncbi:hypothetical protein SCLCIDRAFT_10524 [Scleroderma citrinum Foug A]|uniref:Uncharacterized protein n=1 Tax=Scleroderma citrinum Foug A TaxID=1036808 RepID=A0A0C3D8Z2_9AGAM|nr:hypothetical protein SCLCIDRAFT_10524 [Scleroderma citrinum Foug A]
MPMESWCSGRGQAAWNASVEFWVDGDLIGFLVSFCNDHMPGFKWKSALSAAPTRYPVSTIPCFSGRCYYIVTYFEATSYFTWFPEAVRDPYHDRAENTVPSSAGTRLKRSQADRFGVLTETDHSTDMVKDV